MKDKKTEINISFNSNTCDINDPITLALGVVATECRVQGEKWGKRGGVSTKNLWRLSTLDLGAKGNCLSSHIAAMRRFVRGNHNKIFDLKSKFDGQVKIHISVWYVQEDWPDIAQVHLDSVEVRDILGISDTVSIRIDTKNVDCE